MYKFMDNLNHRIDRALQIILVCLASIVLLVNLAQIAGRYLFFYSIRWSEELSTYAYVWIIFLSLHMITRCKAELAIEVFKFNTPRPKAALAILRDILTLVAVATLFVAAIIMIKNSLRFPRRTASLGITTWSLYLCMPISFFLVFIQKLTNLLGHIGILTGKTVPDKPPED